MCSLELKPQIKQEELITFFCFVFGGGGRRGEGNCFPENNDFLALGESQPSLAVVLKSTAGPGKLTQNLQ